MMGRLLSVCVIVSLLAAPAIALGQDNPVITIELTPYESNPVLRHDDAGDWDTISWLLFPSVAYVDGVFHMFYKAMGSSSRISTGYATSGDGFNWTPAEQNPIFELDPAMGYGGLGSVDLYGETWVGYVCVSSVALSYCQASYRATAPEPTGPWTMTAEPVLEIGASGNWDAGRFFPFSAVETAQGQALYYIDGAFNAFGRATSPDGIVWTKYDDPATTKKRYENSDPIMQVESGWEHYSIGPLVVLPRGNAWEMFYKGGSGEIGYATSADGITWTRFPGNPVLSMPAVIAHLSDVVVVDDVYYVYYHDQTGDIGVATGTVTWE